MHKLSTTGVTRGTLLHRAALASIATAIGLITLKIVAIYLTGSTALLGSFLDSLLDAGASIINLIAIRHALEPADYEHRFGHGKAEALAGLAQSAFIMVSAGLLIWRAVVQILHPTPIAHTNIGIAVTLISIVATILLVRYQKRIVAETHSTAIKADSLHYASDLLLNIAVLIALAGSTWLAIPLLDPVLAIGIAGWIAWGASQIIFTSAEELMDRELPTDEREKIRTLALADPRALDVHDLRTRRAGHRIFVEIHLEMNRHLSLLEAHAIAESAMHRIKKEFPAAEVIIHQDPEGIIEERQAIQEI